MSEASLFESSFAEHRFQDLEGQDRFGPGADSTSIMEQEVPGNLQDQWGMGGRDSRGNRSAGKENRL
jgi:hypothetical protein